MDEQYCLKCHSIALVNIQSLDSVPILQAWILPVRESIMFDE